MKLTTLLAVLFLRLTLDISEQDAGRSFKPAIPGPTFHVTLKDPNGFPTGDKGFELETGKRYDLRYKAVQVHCSLINPRNSATPFPCVFVNIACG